LARADDADTRTRSLEDDLAKAEADHLLTSRELMSEVSREKVCA
jgi:hypothetical protein